MVLCKPSAHSVLILYKPRQGALPLPLRCFYVPGGMKNEDTCNRWAGEPDRQPLEDPAPLRRKGPDGLGQYDGSATPNAVAAQTGRCGSVRPLETKKRDAG